MKPIAKLNGIKGNSVAWNQLTQNGDFSNGTTGWYLERSSSGPTGTISVANNVLTICGGQGDTDFRVASSTISSKIIKDHIDTLK